MSSRLSLAGVAAALTLCLLPIKTGGCGGRQACITMSQAAYDKAGQCPTVAAMQEFFSGNCDSGRVESVDGEGTFDGQLCCYPVTNFNDEFAVEECFGGFGGGGVAGAGGVGGGCASCGMLVDEPGTSPMDLCFEDQPFFDLSTCGCAACDACKLNFCESAPVTVECQSCLQSSCGAEVDACRSSI